MIEVAKNILTEQFLCTHCLGRQFALLGYGLSDKERGEIIQNALVMEYYEQISSDEKISQMIKNISKSNNELATRSFQKVTKEKIDQDKITCELCDGLFDKLPNFVSEIKQLLLKEDYQSFLIGAIFPAHLIEREDNFRAKYSITTSETMKEEFTREIGKSFGNETGKVPSFDLPDMTIIIDLSSNKIKLEKRSLYIYGRYRKFIRTIPQTRWPCWECDSKGCKKCNFTGKMYQESVEELIANPIIKITGGTGSKFHGAGREDIDALMLGNGRSFVLEIQDPKIRTINLKRIKKLVNRKAKGKVKVGQLAISNKKKLQDIKNSSTKTKKTYRAKIALEKEISSKLVLKIVQELHGIVIKQKTPQRVMHRRANLERPRTVYDIKVKKTGEKEIEAEITGQGGLYIKELISGDDGRTLPSFSSIIGFNAKCYQLDVIRLHYED